MGKSSRIAAGQVYGQLTVLGESEERYVEPAGHRRKQYEVRCTCGIQYTTVGNYLLREKAPKCQGCKSKLRRVAKIGDVYDQLTVVSLDHRPNGRLVAVCRCSCGGSAKIRPDTLPRNATNNCGCLPRGGWRVTGLLPLSYYNRVKRGARLRSLPFQVSPSYLWEMYQKQQGRCALSGLAINLGSVTYNFTGSLDRIDSSKGYTESNVQWVHKDINRLKMDLDQDKFITLCRLVAQAQDASTNSMQRAFKA